MTDRALLETGRLAENLHTPQFVEISRETKFRLATFDRKTDNGQRAIDRIPTHGVIVDYGCGSGELGIAVAQVRKCKLLQADIIDRRDPQFRNGDLMKLPIIGMPEFAADHFADTILLTDVLDKIGPGNADIELLTNLLDMLKPNGSILIVSTRADNTETLLRKNIRKRLDAVTALSGKTVFCTGDPVLDRQPKPNIQIADP